MCVDNRNIKSPTKKDAFKFLRIDEVRPMLSKARYFAALDLIMGYNQ